MHASRLLSRGSPWAFVALALALAPGAVSAQPCEEHLVPVQTGVRLSHIGSLAAFDDGLGGGPALYGQGWNLMGPSSNMPGRWDGERWLPVTGIQNSSFYLATTLTVLDDGSGPALYVTGQLSIGGLGAPGTPTRIARWDGQAWSNVGHSLEGSVGGVVVFDDGAGGGPALYAHGWHLAHRPGGVLTPLGGVARWDGAAWVSVGLKSLTSGIATNLLKVDHDGAGPQPPTLYMQSDGGPGQIFLGRLVEGQWEPLPPGGGDRMVAFPTDQGEVLVGIGPSTLDGAPTGGIVQWDGQAWSAVVGTNGVLPLGSPSFLAAADVGDGPALYVFGIRTKEYVRGLAKFQDGAWSLLPEGFFGGEGGGTVFSTAVLDDGNGGGPRLYFGGSFTRLGNLPGSGLARSNGCQPPCEVDFNLDGAATGTDISVFLEAWIGGESHWPVGHIADFDRDGARNSSDISAFITAWLSAVANGC